MTFCEAGDLYLKLRTLPTKRGGYIRDASLVNYSRYIVSLGLFFGSMALSEIKWWNIRAYQLARLNGDEPFVRYRRPQDAKPRKFANGTVLPPKGKTPCPTKAAHVNQELGLLGTIMRRAHAWTDELQQNYEELDEGYPEVGRALTPEEQQLWLNVCRMNPKWELVHWYSIVAFDTCCSPHELRRIRLADVNLHHSTINIPPIATKVKPRNRTIGIEEGDTIWALQKLLERAQRLGCANALHYLFPFGDRAHDANQHLVSIKCKVYDPTRPMSNSGLKQLWKAVQIATGLASFTPGGTRHTGITRKAEAGLPIPVIMATAGHLSPRMTQHYTEVSMAAQRHWAKVAIERRQPQSTFHVKQKWMMQ